MIMFTLADPDPLFQPPRGGVDGRCALGERDALNFPIVVGKLGPSSRWTDVGEVVNGGWNGPSTKLNTVVHDVQAAQGNETRRHRVVDVTVCQTRS